MTNAGIAEPYVLVGHSLGGKNVRLFALAHPEQVAGMVLVDARSEYVDANTSPAELQAFQRANAAQASQFRVARSLGARPPDRREPVGRAGHATRDANGGDAVYRPHRGALMPRPPKGSSGRADDALLQAAPSLGDRPLLVVAAGQNMIATPYWAEAQRRPAALSTNSRLIDAEGSGHAIHWDQPALVVDAVRQVIADVRSR